MSAVVIVVYHRIKIFAIFLQLITFTNFKM